MAITHRQLILIGVTVIGIVTVGAVTGGFSEPLSTQNQSPETAGADFVVSELDDSDRITAGEDLTVWTTIQNPESSEQTRQIALRVDMDGDGVVDTTVAEESVTLGGEQSETVELTVSTESMEPGTYDYGISTGDSSDEPTSSGQFVILRPTTFIVDDTDAESPVVQGDSTTITATVSNTGDFQGVQTVGLYVSDGTSVDDGARGQQVLLARPWSDRYRLVHCRHSRPVPGRVHVRSADRGRRFGQQSHHPPASHVRRHRAERHT
ncbi:hypothetical protein ACFQH8_12420 [Halomicroarcula sp. GCM10025710]